MTQQFAVPDDAPPHHPHYGDAFVVFSVTVLSCAVGAWLLLRLGVALWVGSLAALGVYAALLSLHLLVRRSLTPRAVAAAPAVNPRMPRTPFAEEPGLRPGPPAMPATAPKLQPPGQPTEPARGTEPATPEKRRLAEALSQPRPADPFNFRPSREPSLSASPLPGLARDPAPPAGEPRPGLAPVAPDASQPELRVELVQELIKKLADELNTATATGGAPPATPSPRTPDTEAMIGRSVDALQKTARSMHGRRVQTPTAAPPAPGAARQMPPWLPTAGSGPGAGVGAGAKGATPPRLNPQLARIAEAVAAERLEVLLEPIQALVDGRPRHFEVTTRLLAADGTALDRRDYVTAARASGLMPRIDAAKLTRAARIAGRLGQRGREGSVLASITGDALSDQAFLEAAAAGPRSATGMSLVLSFAQIEVRAFTPGQVKALRDLAPLGLRFALQEVVDLDMDFSALKDMGFAFVELAAPAFLDGLPARGGRIPAADICRHLANFGLTLIVGGIDDDWLLARILGFGVLFGKGALFGGPRPVKDEVIASPTAA